MLPAPRNDDASRLAAPTLKQQFEQCLERDSKGNLRLNVTLPDASALDHLAQSLARLMNSAAQPDNRARPE